MELNLIKCKFEGSFTRRDYLEAFILQSTYVESLIKETISYLFSALEDKVDEQKYPLLKYFAKALNVQFEDIALYRSIELLKNARLISEDQSKDLHTYRIIRNKTFHSLLRVKNESTFENELKNAYKKCEEIMKKSGVIKAIENKIAEYEQKTALKKQEIIKRAKNS